MIPRATVRRAAGRLGRSVLDVRLAGRHVTFTVEDREVSWQRWPTHLWHFAAAVAACIS